MDADYDVTMGGGYFAVVDPDLASVLDELRHPGESDSAVVLRISSERATYLAQSQGYELVIRGPSGAWPWVVAGALVLGVVLGVFVS